MQVSALKASGSEGRATLCNFSTPSLEKGPFSQTWPMANEGLLIETLESSAIHKYSLRQVIFVHKGLFFLAIINILFLFFMSLKARVIFRTLKKIIYGNKRKLFCEHVWFTCILCACLFCSSSMIYFVNMPVFTDWVIVNVEAESFIHQLIHLFPFLSRYVYHYFRKILGILSLWVTYPIWLCHLVHK